MSPVSERGQVLPLIAFWLVGFMGLAALVIDLGSWYQTHRTMQASADAAALAGAQALPTSTGSASALAAQFTAKNDPALGSPSVTFSGGVTPNDTIQVRVTKQAPGFFSQVFGINTVQLHASATARTELIGSARYVAPILVPLSHPDLSGSGCPCFGSDTKIDLVKTGVPGGFDLVTLDGSGTGSSGASTLGSWITSGYDGYLPLGGYFSSAGAKWNSSAVQSALTARLNTTLLFPVYDSVSGTGSNAVYHVVAWVGFYLTGIDARGSSGSLSGHFTQVIWEGIEATGGSSLPPDLGAYGVQLVQ